MTKGQSVKDIYFINQGVAHIYGFLDCGNESFRYKVVTLIQGAWIGDYQVMLDIDSSWDVQAGGDKELSNVSKKSQSSLPANMLMVYMIYGDIFRAICDEYPAFRSFIITRSQSRRSYLIKVSEEARQEILFKKKSLENKKLTIVKKIDNYFSSSSSSEDELDQYAEKK